MLINHLKRAFVLLRLMGKLAVEVGDELHGTFCCIVDGRKAIHQLPEILVILIFLPVGRRFREEDWIEVTELLRIKKLINF